MSGLEGHMAFEKEIMSNPENMIELLATTIKELWKIDVSSYTNNFSLDKKLKLLQERINSNKIDESDFDPDIVKGFTSPQEILDYLIKNKPNEVNVFTHGDYCLPNVLFHQNKLVGFIDLGNAGVSDKYQDISLCLRSMKYNLKDQYKEEYFDLFIKELGITFDKDKYNYYLLLDELF